MYPESQGEGTVTQPCHWGTHVRLWATFRGSHWLSNSDSTVLHTMSHDDLAVDFPDPDICIKCILDHLSRNDFPAAGIFHNTVFQEEELITKGKRLIQIVQR